MIKLNRKDYIDIAVGKHSNMFIKNIIFTHLETIKDNISKEKYNNFLKTLESMPISLFLKHPVMQNHLNNSKLFLEKYFNINILKDNENNVLKVY